MPGTAQPIPGAEASAPAYRHDIDGLRAVAILLVVVYHVWVGRVSGGVDAFLMISAFFLTGSFVRRLERGKPLDIGGQWIRTFKRLLPPAAVVLVATLAAGLAFLPDSRLIDFFRQIWASLFYVENWKLANDATDYYANKADASPVQHFWSLSVQGQVFLLWPLLFLIVLLIVRRTSLRVRPVSAVLFSTVFIASFVYSVLSTSSNQEYAYFDTRARVWEFAAGALLAIALPWIRVPRWLGAVLGWGGLAALISCGLVIDVQGGFPGYLALWPVLSVAAIIVSGTTQDRPSLITRTLGWRPLVALGHDAYGLYLAHWPILIFTIQAKRGESLTFLDGLIVIAASLVAARLLTWLVDDRIRYAKWANATSFRGVLVILLSVILVAAPTAYYHWTTHQQLIETRELVKRADPTVANPGAAVLEEGWVGEIPDYAPPIPLAGDIESDWGGLPEDCSEWFATAFTEYDAGCNALSADEPSLTVVVIGDSHAQQWLPAIAEVGSSQNWFVYSLLKGACPLALRDPEAFEDLGFGYSCVGWMDEVFALVDEIRPDLVVTVGTAASRAGEDMDADAGARESLPDGQDIALDVLEEMGVPVVLLRDNPRFTFNAYECADAVRSGSPDVAESYGANPDCGVSRSRALASENPAESVVRPGIAEVDMTDRICRERDCPAIIGNVFVYLDSNHLSASYSKTLAPALEPRLAEAAARAASWE